MRGNLSRREKPDQDRHVWMQSHVLLLGSALITLAWIGFLLWAAIQILSWAFS
jgi:hypothetical protein